MDGVICVRTDLVRFVPRKTRSGIFDILTRAMLHNLSIDRPTRTKDSRFEKPSPSTVIERHPEREREENKQSTTKTKILSNGPTSVGKGTTQHDERRHFRV